MVARYAEAETTKIIVRIKKANLPQITQSFLIVGWRQRTAIIPKITARTKNRHGPKPLAKVATKVNKKSIIGRKYAFLTKLIRRDY